MCTRIHNTTFYLLSGLPPSLGRTGARDLTLYVHPGGPCPRLSDGALAKNAPLHQTIVEHFLQPRAPYAGSCAAQSILNFKLVSISSDSEEIETQLKVQNAFFSNISSFSAYQSACPPGSLPVRCWPARQQSGLPACTYAPACLPASLPVCLPARCDDPKKKRLMRNHDLQDTQEKATIASYVCSSYLAGLDGRT